MREVPARKAEEAAGSKVAPSTWIGFAAMGLGMFMAVLDVQVVVTSLPAIGSALAIPPDRMSWLQTAYLIAEVIAIPLTGTLTRALSMRGLFAAAVVLFTLASIGCAGSGGFASLIGWRLLQGFSGGVLIPVVFSAVFLLFPVEEQGLATTIAGVLAVAAPVVGPFVGGWITQTYSWHWLFLINVAPGLAAALAGSLSLPARRPDFRHARMLDWIALVLMAMALACLEIGLKEAPQRGWSSGLTVVLFGLSATTLWMFVRRTLRVPHPLVPLDRLKDRRFALGCWLSFVLGAGLYGSVYLMPVFLAFVRGHGPLDIGRIMLVTGFTQLAMSPIAVALERRSEARFLSAVGFGCFALGLGLGALSTRLTDFDGMLWPQIVRGGAMMFCLLPPTRLALGHLPREQVPGASGIFNLMRNIGGAIAIAVLDTIVYGRAPEHANALVTRLMQGDADAARRIGLPEAIAAGVPTSLLGPNAQALAKPLVEASALAAAIDEAWAALAAFTLVALLAVPIALRASSTEQDIAAPSIGSL